MATDNRRKLIRERFGENLARVQNLVTLYEKSRDPGQGRRPVHSTDILRAATVLLHASLEDALRSIAAWKLPHAGAEVLDDVPLVGLSEHGRPEKFFLGRLAPHRSKTVQEVIESSVQSFLGSFTINSTTDIAVFAKRVGVDAAAINSRFVDLTEMIQRRHHIVHQADRNEQIGAGQQIVRSLSSARVEIWIEATKHLIDQFVRLVPDPLI